MKIIWRMSPFISLSAGIYSSGTGKSLTADSTGYSAGREDAPLAQAAHNSRRAVTLTAFGSLHPNFARDL